MAEMNAIAEYIYRRAQQLGVDPNMALGIARFEGLNPNTLGAPTFGNKDAAGYSFGPFQLYSASPDPSKIAPGGLAYEFQQRFGSAPSRENWQQQVDFSLETMKNRGVSPWYAVRDQGGVEAITQKGQAFAGELGLRPAAVSSAPLAPPSADAAAPAADTASTAGGILGGLSSLASAIGGLLGGGGGGGGEAATPAPAPSQPPQPQPVYAADIGTGLRRLGNTLAPDLVDPAKPLSQEEILAQREQQKRLGELQQAQKGFGALAAAGAPRQQAEAPMPSPQTRPVAFAPLKRLRTLREVRGLLG